MASLEPASVRAREDLDQIRAVDPVGQDGQKVVHVDGAVVVEVRGVAAVLKPLIKKADVVIPLAALVGAPLCRDDEIGTVTTNRDAVVTLTRILSKEQRILIPTTNSGYGIGEAGKYCTEETPLLPISSYGKTKVEAESAVLDRGNAISFRLATVFGMAPRMRIDLLVNDFVYRAVYDRTVVLFEAHFKRNYIHIRDVAHAFLHGIGRAYSPLQRRRRA